MDIPIYFNESQEALASFTKIFEEQDHFKGKTISILHLGAYTGHATKWMLEHVNGRSIDVDTWAGSTVSDGHLDNHQEFYDNRVEALYDETVSGLPVTKFKGTTQEFFAQNKETFDFIYVDASHKRSDVALDLQESWKILNTGGIMACDDYMWNMSYDSSLIPHYAIKKFATYHAAEIEILIDGYQFWFKKII